MAHSVQRNEARRAVHEAAALTRTTISTSRASFHSRGSFPHAVHDLVESWVNANGVPELHIARLQHERIVLRHRPGAGYARRFRAATAALGRWR